MRRKEVRVNEKRKADSMRWEERKGGREEGTDGGNGLLTCRDTMTSIPDLESTSLLRAEEDSLMRVLGRSC